VKLVKLVKLPPAYHLLQSERLSRAKIADIAPARMLAENGLSCVVPTTRLLWGRAFRLRKGPHGNLRSMKSGSGRRPEQGERKSDLVMWLDNETDRDFLNFEGVADTIAEVIVSADGRPVSIGVSGAWGVGHEEGDAGVRGQSRLMGKRGAFRI
jgi:hypothetical protein